MEETMNGDTLTRTCDEALCLRGTSTFWYAVSVLYAGDDAAKLHGWGRGFAFQAKELLYDLHDGRFPISDTMLRGLGE
jgi:hypothetical protein